MEMLSHFRTLEDLTKTLLRMLSEMFVKRNLMGFRKVLLWNL